MADKNPKLKAKIVKKESKERLKRINELIAENQKFYQHCLKHGIENKPLLNTIAMLENSKRDLELSMETLESSEMMKRVAMIEAIVSVIVLVAALIVITLIFH